MIAGATDPKKPPFNPIALEDLEELPLLHSLAKRIRAVLNAFFTVRDVKSLNIQEYERFVALLNTDLVFRLKVTREYALLLELFKDPLEKARWAKFLDDVFGAERREHQKLEYLDEVEKKAHKKPKLDVASRSSGALSNEYPFSWSHPDPLLSDSEKLQHYEAELHRITCDYHTQRASVHSDFILRYLEEETGYIDTLIKALNPLIPEEQEAISKLITIKKDIFDRHEAILSRGLGSSMDLALSQSQDRELHALLHNYIDTCLNGLDSANPKVKALIEQHARSMAVHKGEIRDIELDFSVQARTLLSHVEYHHFENTKEKALDHLSSLIKSTESISKGFDENQRTHVNSIVGRLRNHCQLLLQAQDLPSVQAVFRDWSIDSAQLRQLVREPLFEAISSDLIALDEIALEVYRERVESSDNLGVQVSSKTNEDSFLPTEAQKTEASVLNFDECDPIKKTKQYCLRLFFLKNRGSQEEVPQQKAAIADLIWNTKEILNDDNSFGNNDDRALELATELKRALDEINECETYQEAPDHTKDSFSVAFNELADISTVFCRLKEQYGGLFFPQEPPSPQPGL